MTVAVDAEITALMRCLQQERDHVLGAVERLSDEALRRPVLPSGWVPNDADTLLRPGEPAEVVARRNMAAPRARHSHRAPPHSRRGALARCAPRTTT